MSDTHYKQSVVIKFLVKIWHKPLEILRKFQMVYGDLYMSKKHVFEWVKWFNEGGGAGICRRRSTCGSSCHLSYQRECRSFACTDSSYLCLSICALSEKLNINKPFARCYMQILRCERFAQRWRLKTYS